MLLSNPWVALMKPNFFHNTIYVCPIDVIHVPPVCSARVIFESDLMQDFLELKQNKGATATKEDNSSPAQGRKVERKPDIRVLLPNHTIVTVPISEHWRTPEVFQVQLLLQNAHASNRATEYVIG